MSYSAQGGIQDWLKTHRVLSASAARSSKTPGATPSVATPGAVVAPKRNFLLWGAVAVLGVGGFLYLRKRGKKSASAPTGETV
jgi:hypothetical protein